MSPLLALFDRSLRADTRAHSTYRQRGGLAGILLMGILVVGIESRAPAVTGLRLFYVLMWLQGLAITILGVSWFASAITEEKEETTLGLLQMTNLNPVSLLLGKSASRLCGALLLLLAPLPFAILTVMLGGVSLDQIQAGYCTLIAYTFLVSNLALLWSVLMPSTSVTALGVTASLLSLFLASPLLREMRDLLLSMDWLTPGGTVDRHLKTLSEAMRLMSPSERLTSILQTGFHARPIGWQVVSNLVIGTLCFVLAWAVFTRFADRAQTRLAIGERLERDPGRTAKKPPRVWRNALAWKDFYFLSGGWPAVLSRFMVYGLAVAGGMLARKNGEPTNLGVAFCFVAVGGPVIELAAIAARAFGPEVRDHTWASLALLPMTTGQIVRSKLLGALLGYLPALCAVGAMFWFWIETEPAPLPPGKTSLTTTLISAAIAAIAASLLVALFSLRLRHGGAWVLAGAAALWFMFRNARVEALGIAFYAFIILVMCIELHRQLENVAGDG
jgi:hypothetical protein